ncbi:uncharacterized protein LOC143300338 [Babylonia areolata]|uniref:uncharacterized protein LOC143300338 n=1 Tax=Babylonia areolata TaxID=304850 RepID=UPI003FD20C3D
MAIGRSRYGPPFTTTKGHSVLKQRSYTMPSRTAPSSTMPRASKYETRAEEYLLADRVSNVNYLSNALMDEGYDTAMRSRGRDQALLKEATNAIPRRSLRDTATLTSSTPSFGTRRFPRRFGKAGLRKHQSSNVYDTRLPAEGRTLSTSDLVASPPPAPVSWRRYGRGQSSSAVKSYLEDDDDSPDSSAYAARASSVGPLTSSSAALSTQPPLSYSGSRRHLPPYPVSSVSESHVLDGSSKPWGQSVSPSRLGSHSSPTRPDYEPPYKEYEPDILPSPPPRRRQRVLGTSRRPAGNYYQRLLRKRSKKQGRFGPYYDLESIEGSDLSGVLSDVDSYDGTYENENDYESRSVSPASSRYLSTSSAVSPYSPFFVDQDTEYVPFKPARPLLTKGLLEITSPYDDDSELSNSQSLPSPTADLSLSTYVPSSLVSAATSGSTFSSRLPYRSVVPFTPTPLPSDNSLAVVSSSPSPSQKLLDSLVSSAVQRAKSTIDNLAIPEYQGASLLLSVEGSGMSPEGKPVNFTYTPPPIPLYGRGLGLDEKLLAIKPASTLKPVDSFISGYMERMGALRAALSQSLDKDRERRAKYGLKPLDTGPTPSSTSTYSSSYTPSYRRSYTPSYTQSYDYVPVKHLSSEKLERLPVTTFRRRHDDRNTHRLDVFSLGEFRPRLSSSTERAITIPESATGGHQLSVLDKINIKAAIIASKLEPDPIKRRRPRSEFAASKYRELRKEALESTSGGGQQSQSSGSYGYSLKSSQYKYSRKTEVQEDENDKPKSIMSWKYRLDSMLTPSDLLYKPSSLIRIREQVKDAQEKMNRHREMLDKYLPEGGPETGDVASNIRRRMAAMERRDPVGLGRRERKKVREEETTETFDEE